MGCGGFLMFILISALLLINVVVIPYWHLRKARRKRTMPLTPKTHRLRLHIPREGWFWLILAANLLLIGWGRNINLVMPLSYFLLLLFGLNALFGWPGLCRLRAVRRFPDFVFAGSPFTFEVAVSNPARARIGLRIVDRGPSHRVAWFLVRFGNGETVRLTGALTLPKRGRYRWGELIAASGYPFGLVEWQTALVAAEDVIVLPRLGRLHRGRLRRFLNIDTPREERLRPSGRPSPTARSEFHGLRPMRTGDSPRWIHWRTSARRGELMVREFEHIVGDDLFLVVDPPEDARLLEEVVSLTATIVWEWCRQRGDQLTLVLLGPTPVHWKGTTGPDLARMMLEGLAVLGSQPGPSDDSESVLRAQRSLNSTGPVLLIGSGRGERRDKIAEQLRRPVAWLDAGRLDTCDFYERPAPDAP